MAHPPGQRITGEVGNGKRLTGGQRSETVYDSGIMWKLPWPLQTAEVYDVSTIRQLHLTGRQVRDTGVNLWTDNLGYRYDSSVLPSLWLTPRLT